MKINKEKLLADLIKKLEYSMVKHVLIKPLPTIKIDKETTSFVNVKDEDGKDIYETDELTGQVVLKTEPKTTVENVEANFQEGVVLLLPEGFVGELKPGDIIVYPRKTAAYFDLFKDSMLLNSYDIIAIKNKIK